MAVVARSSNRSDSGLRGWIGQNREVSAIFLVLVALRRLALAGTEMAQAQCGTIRLRLLKIGAQVRITARKIWISMAAGHPAAAVFATAHRKLMQAIPLRS